MIRESIKIIAPPNSHELLEKLEDLVSENPSKFIVPTGYYAVAKDENGKRIFKHTIFLLSETPKEPTTTNPTEV